MGAITSKEGLLEYLKQVIDIESAVLSQKNLIQEYDENSEERKPQLKLLDMPEKPQVTREIEYPAKNDYIVCLVTGVVGSIVGVITLIAIISMLGEASEEAFLVFMAAFMAVLAGGGGIWGFWNASTMRKNVENNYDTAMNDYTTKANFVRERNGRCSSQYWVDMDVWEKSNKSAHAYFEKPLEETQAVLDKLYSVDVIYPKYRNLPALTCIYEYLVTGRCDELAGPHGAYNLYEDEVRQNMVISQLNAIMENLEQIKANQYLLYEQLTKIRKESAAITRELRMIHGYAAALTEISSLNAYYAGITAGNTAALAYYQTL